MSKEKKKASNKSVGDGTLASRDLFSTPKAGSTDMRTPYTGAPVEYPADCVRETTFCRHLIDNVVEAITSKSSNITEKLPTKKEARRLGADHGHLLNEKQGTVRMDQFIRVGCDKLPCE